MATIKDRRISVDPRFGVPAGVLDVNQEKEVAEDGGTTSSGVSASLSSATSSETFRIEAESEQMVALPKSFSVTKQTIRMTSDGRAVVDVEIEFTDHDDISDVELRHTKI